MDQFNRVLELSIAEEDEVEKIVFNLAFKEREKDSEVIKSKWIFAIIYDAYIHLNDEIKSIYRDWQK